MRTKAAYPNLDPEPLLKQFRILELNLPRKDLSENPDDPWRVFTELDFHWNRFAMWMGVAEKSGKSDEADTADPYPLNGDAP